MGIGEITHHIDTAQLVFATFVLFFFGLVFYLRREDKRDGYPMIDPADGHRHDGFPERPPPKVLYLMEGGTTQLPKEEEGPEPTAWRKLFFFPGAPMVPTGQHPLRDRVGPAAYAMRSDQPLIYLEGEVQMLPLRDAPGWRVAEGEADPRGMAVVCRDGVVAGTVDDLWVDRSVKILRYLEVALTGTGQRALIPIYYTDVKRARREVRVDTLTARELSDAPPWKNPDRLSAREEDEVNAFFAGATLFRHQNLPEAVR